MAIGRLDIVPGAAPKVARLVVGKSRPLPGCPPGHTRADVATVLSCQDEQPTAVGQFAVG